MVTNNSKTKSAYFWQLGYQHRLTPFVSAEIDYKRVATIDSTVTTNTTDFSKKYDAYGAGLRVDQPLGYMTVYAKGGASYVIIDTKMWDSTTSSYQTETDKSVKPYASAGVSIASPYDKRLTLGISITYQWLPGNEHATSLSAGANLAF